MDLHTPTHPEIQNLENMDLHVLILQRAGPPKSRGSHLQTLDLQNFRTWNFRLLDSESPENQNVDLENFRS